MENVRLTVSDFIALANQTLEYAYPEVTVEGEVQGFKVNQNKYVFFDLKDKLASVGCFMTVWQLRLPLEDGMKIAVYATPKLTSRGKFSLTVRAIQPLGEGSLKRSQELLKAKLARDGLFDKTRKRSLPELPSHIGVISSIQASGYTDFIEIMEKRWGGMKIEVAHVQVQGLGAPDQVIRALEHFNQAERPPEVIAIIRGGGSLDDLSTFNDELLVRAVAASRVPTITGIGHEADTSLADMAADKRAATPSNAAQLLVPESREISSILKNGLEKSLATIENSLLAHRQQIERQIEGIAYHFNDRLDKTWQRLRAFSQTLAQLNPDTILGRGYAIARLASGKLADKKAKIGEELLVEIKDAIITTGVKNVRIKD